jgi:hypothetical protein
MNNSTKLKTELICCASLIDATIRIREFVYARSLDNHTTSCIIWMHNNDYQFACETPTLITQGHMTCKIGCGFSFFESI